MIDSQGNDMSRYLNVAEEQTMKNLGEEHFGRRNQAYS